MAFASVAAGFSPAAPGAGSYSFDMPMRLRRTLLHENRRPAVRSAGTRFSVLGSRFSFRVSVTTIRGTISSPQGFALSARGLEASAWIVVPSRLAVLKILRIRISVAQFVGMGMGFFPTNC